jgi:hypothetical protein
MGGDFRCDCLLSLQTGLALRVFQLVDVAQLVEHLVVIQDVAGSSPVVHPFHF